MLYLFEMFPKERMAIMVNFHVAAILESDMTTSLIAWYSRGCGWNHRDHKACPELSEEVLALGKER